MDSEKQYFLAVVRPENLDQLKAAGLGFYALKRESKIRAGDRIVLYRSRGSGGSGFVGVFEAVTDPQLVKRATGQSLFFSLYPYQVRWRPIVTTLETPMPIAPLVPDLTIFPNKKKYGAILQLSLKRLPQADYEVIEKALRTHIESE